MAQPTFERMFSDAQKPKQPAAQPEHALEEALAPAYTAWKDKPGPASAAGLLKSVDPIITSALRTYGGPSQASPTMRSAAKRIVLESLPRYDPARSKLRTYLMTNLQSLHRAAAEEQQIIGVPERVRLDQGRLHTARTELLDRLGREPSDAELASHSGLPLKRIAHIRKASPLLAEGQLGGVDDETGDQVESVVAVQPRNRDVYLEFVYGDLGPVDQFIMENALGLHGNRVLPKSEIARRLKISAGAVSQRAAKIQKLIDKHDAMQLSLF